MFKYRPVACKQTYRMIVVRKNISKEKGERRLFDERDTPQAPPVVIIRSDATS